MSRQRRSIEEKQAIVAYAKAHSVVAAARHFGVHPNQVTEWKHGRKLGMGEDAAPPVAPRPRRHVPPKSPRSPEPFERTPVDHQWLRERAITGMWRGEIA